MPTGADKSFDNFDFLDFAQEFLRRNAIYQAEFARLSRGMPPNFESTDFRNMARSWGLEFRSSTGSPSEHASRNLACL
jgi:Family of unknown function (DUF6499)